ncbi:hypothetical protein, partial [Pseudovibrio exalbescens]|uniref:hypothetical protein n=1 Tax=Pseudovibrio exalbescens TaxID=197461 RepID=UPI0015BD08C0
LWMPDQRLAALPLSGMTSVGRIGLAHLALDSGSALGLSGMTPVGRVVARVFHCPATLRSIANRHPALDAGSSRVTAPPAVPFGSGCRISGSLRSPCPV